MPADGIGCGARKRFRQSSCVKPCRFKSDTSKLGESFTRPDAEWRHRCRHGLRPAACHRGLCIDRRVHDRRTRRSQWLHRLVVLAPLRQQCMFRGSARHVRARAMADLPSRPSAAHQPRIPGRHHGAGAQPLPPPQPLPSKRRDIAAFRARTDLPVGAAGFEPPHSGIENSPRLQPGAAGFEPPHLGINAEPSPLLVQLPQVVSPPAVE